MNIKLSMAFYLFYLSIANGDLISTGTSIYFEKEDIQIIKVFLRDK